MIHCLVDYYYIIIIIIIIIIIMMMMVMMVCLLYLREILDLFEIPMLPFSGIIQVSCF